MRCKRAEDSLDAYLAGEMSPPVRRRIPAHTASCQECRGQTKRLTVAAAWQSPVAAWRTFDAPGRRWKQRD